ncbi:sigma-70 family RNA polymerase sigma factor [Bacteroidales bacterium AH-315-I05]|nr:sigma-70 family RNA polymerase sigma factor [Bacteroidales bacterium AH-315-I05]
MANLSTHNSQHTKSEPSQWVELYSDYLFVYAFARVHKKEVAEDLVQDTFVSAIKAKDSFQQKSTERTWLTSILKNKIIDYYKKKSTQSEISIGADEDSENPNTFFETEGSRQGMWQVDARPGFWDTDYKTPVEKIEFYTILNQCLENLPEQWAAVFTLKNMEDFDAQEICKELNISSSNYWVIMHRSKLQLRDCMSKNWFAEK